MRVRECVAPSLVDNPQRAYEYWKANIPQSDWYDEAKEAFVVLVLNTRSRIIGHKAIELAQNELNALILFNRDQMKQTLEDRACPEFS
jgi:DNA repair protein RadC